MFCRYCGKEILNDSSFCPYCGKPLKVKKQNFLYLVSNTGVLYFKKNYINLLRVFCYITLFSFLILNFIMAPGLGWVKILSYILEGVLAIFFTVIAIKTINKNSSKVKLLSIFMISSFIIGSSIVLSVIYLNKVDYVRSSIPSNGVVTVKINEDSDYYTYNSFGPSFVRDPGTIVKINSEKYISQIYTGKENTLYVYCSGYSNTGKGNTGKDRNSITETIVINASDFKDGKMTIIKDVSMGLYSAEVTIELERICGFWEVIFY